MYNFFYVVEHTRKNLEETGAYTDTDVDSPVSSTKSESESNSNAIRRETSLKDTYDQASEDRRKSEMETSQLSNSGDDSSIDETSVVHTKLPPGKVTLTCLKNNHWYWCWEKKQSIPWEKERERYPDILNIFLTFYAIY